jgi:malate dehydrogenase (oxaloacetate-decarboxylating)(NADP+)
MLELGLGDVLISGLTKDYDETLVPALRVVGVSPNWKRVAGMYIVNTRHGQFFFADTTVNLNPTAEELVEIVGLTAEKVRFFGQTPRIAMISYSNFGSVDGEEAEKMRNATELAKKRYPGLIIDGEVQANIALKKDMIQELYPFSDLAAMGANTLIFPNLSAGNASYKLLQELGSAEVIGPVLLGAKKPIHILQMGATVREIINMVVIGVVEAQVQQQTRQFVLGME